MTKASEGTVGGQPGPRLNIRLQTQLLAIVGGGFVAFAIISFIAHRHLVGLQTNRQEMMNGREVLTTLSLQAQLHFKIQVQEWKNVLLRGHVSEDYAKYFGQFESEERRVQELISKLRDGLPEHSAVMEPVVEFRSAHLEMGERYRAALREHFRSGGKDSARATDRAVRGMDRAPTDILDRVVAAVNDETVTELRLNRERNERATQMTLATFSGATPLAFVSLLAFIHFYIRRPTLECIDFASRLSGEDFSADLKGVYRGELAQLRESLILMRDKLHGSRQKLLLHIRNTPVGVIDRDFEGKVVAWNPAAQRIFGWNDEEVVGRRLEELVNVPEDALDLDGDWMPLNKALMQESAVARCGTKAGDGIVCEWVSTELLDERGEAVGVASLVRNITKRVKLERQLRQSQKMEAIGQLAAGAAHDFNNLVTIIRGHAALLAMAHPEGDENHESVKEIDEAAERAAGLTGQLLAFSRKQATQTRPVDLNEVVSGASRMLQRMLNEEIKLDIKTCGQPAVAYVDVRMFEQAVMNLVLNARDAMPEGGKLLVDTEIIELDDEEAKRHPEAASGKFVCVSVHDDGCGMDKETQSRIFEPFFTTKGVGEGSGLGLASVYGVAKQHNGWVEVVSAVGDGSSFRVFFPLAE